MRWIPDLGWYVRFLMSGEDVRRDIDDELAFHLERRAEILQSQGMSPAEAEREARRRFGDVDRVRRECRVIGKGRVRTRRWTHAIDDLKQDVGYAVRGLRRSPGYTAVAILTLALGIGGTTAIFSLVNPYLLRALPFHAPDRLVHLYTVDRTSGFDRSRFSLPQYLDVREGVTAFRDLAAYDYRFASLSGGPEPERVAVGRVTGNMFPLLGTPAALGRTFVPGDDRPGGPEIVVLRYDLWQRRFAGDPGIVGRTVRLDGVPHVVVGVMPPDFNFPFGEVKMWVPLPRDLERFDRKYAQFLVVGRLASGVGIEAAGADVERVHRQLAAAHPRTDGRFDAVTVVPLREGLLFYYDMIRAMLLLLAASVTFVLLIVVANVANLALARALGRRREVAIRAALGGGRFRLIRQFLTESAVLALAGGALGVGLAVVATDRLATAMPEALYRVGAIRVDATALVFTLGVSLLAALLFGIAPALRGTRLRIADALSEGGARLAGGRIGRLRGSLVVSQVGLALVLLTGAGLLIDNLIGLQRIDSGFDERDALTFQLTLPPTRYPDAASRVRYFDDVRARLAALPGVRNVGIVYPIPLNFETMTETFEPEGWDAPNPDRLPYANYIRAGPGYFAAMGIPLLRGRAFAGSDDADAPAVAVISDKMARRYWPRADPIGRRIRLGDADEDRRWVTIVGVVGDVKHRNLYEETWPQLYVPFAQSPVRLGHVVLRFAGGTKTLTAAARRAVWSLDADVPIDQARTLRTLVADSVGPFRMASWWVTLLGLVALILASVGIYGVVAYTVNGRRGEIGIRIAMGAGRWDVLRLVLKQGAVLAGIGLTGGLVVAVALSRVLASAFGGALNMAPLAFAATGVLLGGITMLATYVPARRAARVDPMVALRCE